jgi:hypothetical protein
MTKGAQSSKSPGRRDSADILVPKLRRNKLNAYIQSSTPPSSERRPYFETLTYLEENKILVMDLEETEARNDCAGEGQHKSNEPTNQQANKNKASQSSLEKARVVSPQLAVGRLTRRRSSQTVTPDGGVEGRPAPIVVGRCVATPNLVVRPTPASEDRRR